MNKIAILFLIFFLCGCTSSHYSTTQIEQFNYANSADIILDITSKSPKKDEYEAAKLFLEMLKKQPISSKANLLNNIKLLTDDDL